MLAEFTQWFLGLIKQVFVDAWTFITDAAVWVVGSLLGVIGSLLAAIPVPSFLQGGMAGMVSGLDGGIWYLCSAAGLPQALAIIGAGYAFRLTRKAVTLFQW